MMTGPCSTQLYFNRPILKAKESTSHRLDSYQMSRPFAATFRSINPLGFTRHAAKQGRNVRYGGQRSYASSDPAPFPMAQRRSLLRPINFLVVLVPFFTASLGVWQVKRLRWKLDLIDEVQANIEREPMVLPPNIK